MRGAVDIVHARLRHRLGAHHAAEARPVDDDDGDDDRGAGPVPAPRPAGSTNSTGGNAIQISTRRETDAVDPAAEIAGEQPERRADEAGGELAATKATMKAMRAP